MEKKVTIIPATKPLNRSKEMLYVGIYCRVSSAKKEQLKSMASQVSGLTRMVLEHNNKPNKDALWKLQDIYIDVAPGSDSNRDQFKRMLLDAAQGKINLVVVKSSSRLGRDTVEVIQACRDLAHFECDIYFQNSDTYYSKCSTLALEAAAGVDHDENENRSSSIRWGIRRQVEDGTSKIFNRACYGYEHDDQGELVIREDQAVIVRKIFMLYLSGASILSIKRTLEGERVPAPRGGEAWPKKTIEMILRNSKYSGSPIVHVGGKAAMPRNHSGFSPIEWGDFRAIGSNRPIISPEMFTQVQEMLVERSNVEFNPDGTKTRKGTHYSSKQERNVGSDK